jgi:uncharacterized protein
VPDGLGLELVRAPLGATLDLDVRLESVMEGVLASGTVVVPIEGECGRCLEELRDEFVVDFQELYAYPDSETDDTTTEDEVSRLRGDLLDLEPVLRDAVVLALPVNPLCRDDCPGLCQDCGVKWDDLPADHTHDQDDPRWAALRTLYDASPDDPAGGNTSSGESPAARRTSPDPDPAAHDTSPAPDPAAHSTSAGEGPTTPEQE